MEYNFNDELCREVHERYSSARFAGLEEAMRMIYEDAQLKKILERGDLANLGALRVFVKGETGDTLSFSRFDGCFALSVKKSRDCIRAQNGNFESVVSAVRNKRQVYGRLKDAVLDYVVEVDKMASFTAKI